MTVDARPVPDAIEAYFRAVNSRDWAAMPPLFADDVELRPVGAPRRVGRDDVSAYYPELLANFAEAHDTVVATHVADGGVVTVEIAFEGRTVAGAPVAFDAVDVFKLDDRGRIKALSLWYDIRSVIRQIKAVEA